MTIKHLRIFTEVCRQGSATRAAEALHMTQPAVSRAIREMEDYYHLRLFERDNQRLKLTECGHIFSERAARLVSEFDLL
ncbi:MAG: LysR family transcriptional regulator [Clostridia bacterium]|nr:LysR family transcriptional regulator [Clostridia bacterium]